MSCGLEVGPALRLLLEAAAITLCLLLPGAALLRWRLRERWTRLAAFRKAGYSLVVSMLAVAAVEATAFFLPAGVTRTLAFGAFFGCLAAGWPVVRGGKGRRAWKDSKYAALAVLLALLGSLIVATQLMAPIPGPVSAGYGDLPSYYRVIDNLARGRLPLVDFRIGDLYDETYFLPTSYPLVTLVATFFRTVLFDDRYVLTLTCSIVGLIGLFFCGGWVHERCRERGLAVDPRLAVLSAGLLPLLPAGHAFDFVLGALSLPVLTLSLILVELVWGRDAATPVPRRILAGSCAAALCLARPEGLLLVVLLAAAASLIAAVRWIHRGPVRRRAAWAIPPLFVLLLPALAPYQHYAGKTASVFYLHYSETAGRFLYNERIHSVEWRHVMYDNAAERVGVARQSTAPNPAFLAQAFRHPWAFFEWLAGRCRHRLGGSSILMAIAVAALLVSRRREGLVLAVATPLYLAVLTSINPAFSTRHSLPLLSLLLAAAVAGAGPAVGRLLLGPLPRPLGSLSLLFAATLPFLSLGVFEAVRVRLDDCDSTYVEILAALEPLVDSSTLVASTYPQLMSYALDVEAVGSSKLLLLAEASVKTYRPDVVVFDEVRPDLPHEYDVARFFVESGRSAELGYEVVVEDPARRYMILKRVTALPLTPSPLPPAPVPPGRGAPPTRSVVTHGTLLRVPRY